MPSAIINTGSIWEDYPTQLMARIVGNDGSYITQATISTITYKVIDTSDGTVVVSNGSMTVASVVFDTMQSDSRWELDDVGYNFRAEIAGASFPSSGRVYRVEVLFTPSSGSAFIVVFDLTSVLIYGS